MLETRHPTPTERSFFSNLDFRERVLEGAKRAQDLHAESAWTVLNDPLNPGKIIVLPIIFGTRNSVADYADDETQLTNPVDESEEFIARGKFHFHPRNTLSFSMGDMGHYENLVNGAVTGTPYTMQ